MNYSLTMSNTGSSINIISCATFAGGYFYIIKPSGTQLGKVDIPKDACRTDNINLSYFDETGSYTAYIYDYNNVVQVSKSITVSCLTDPIGIGSFICGLLDFLHLPNPLKIYGVQL